ncbi:hypothetical protein NLI96_g1866 [Meripilus lineatus]|uniref:Uncharacterized protein n=1 Tax=Meripilus lineatus TaxID=2056292 RepID=A0AAD5V9U2_9APHY|nr:hypothetical protein NLI96_g1866 [Physisporinus lineatus]
MISDTFSCSELSSHRSQARIDREVEIQTHDPAVNAQIVPFMEPRVERNTWAQPIDLEIRAKLRQMERGTYWHPIVNVTLLPPGDLQPRLPPEILDLIIHFIGPESDFRRGLCSQPAVVSVVDGYPYARDCCFTGLLFETPLSLTVSSISTALPVHPTFCPLSVESRYDTTNQRTNLERPYLALQPWHPQTCSDAGRQPRCSTAQICRSVPSVSVAFAAFMRTTAQWVSNTVDTSDGELYVEWKWEKHAQSVDQSPWSLYLRLDEVGFTALVKFQAHTNFLHPSFDLSHIVEFRTTIPLHMDVDDDDLDTLFSVWKHDQLTRLEVLDRLQIGIQIGVDDSFWTSIELADLLEYIAWQGEADSDILNRLEHGFEPLRECDRRFDLEITVCGNPFDDVLRGWKERKATEEREKDVEATKRGSGGEGTENTETVETTEEIRPDSRYEPYALLLFS